VGLMKLFGLKALDELYKDIFGFFKKALFPEPKTNT